MIANPLISGSLVMIVGSNFVNFLSYFYHLVLGRLLGPENYGELAAIFSLIGLIAMLPTSLGLTVTKFVSSAKGEKETKELISWLNHYSRMIAAGTGILTLALSPLIQSFLNISSIYLIWMVGVMFLFSIPAFFNRSILQGLLNFQQSIFSIIVENLFKVFGGILFVFLGYSVFGALGAILVGVIAGWLISRHYIKQYFNLSSVPHIDIAPMVKFSLPVLVQALAITSLISVDIILVKHYFSPAEVGLYAALATLSKIILFASGPIGAVMFPLISKRNAKGSDYRQVLSYSFILTILISVVILGTYYLFPKMAIQLLYGEVYTSSYALLFPFGVFITLYTLSSMLLNFCLSVNKTKAVFIALFFAILQIVGIVLFHSSLSEVVTVSIVVCVLMFLALLVFSNRIISLQSVIRGKYI